MKTSTPADARPPVCPGVGPVRLTSPVPVGRKVAGYIPDDDPEPAILLDFDDSLVDDVPAARAAIGSTLTGLGLHADQAAVAAVLVQAQRRWNAHPHRRTGALTYVSSWEALWLPQNDARLPNEVAASLADHDRRVWADALEELGADPGMAPDAAALFRRVRAGLLRPLPGVRAVLTAMRQTGHQVWLVTNGLPAHQHAKIDASGLGPYFAKVFISGDVGAAKSEPPFATAVTRVLTIERRRVCMVVGDSPVHDLGLAAHGGWPGVHLCRAARCRDRADTRAGVVHAATLDLALGYCLCSGVTPGVQTPVAKAGVRGRAR